MNYRAVCRNIVLWSAFAICLPVSRGAVASEKLTWGPPAMIPLTISDLKTSPQDKRQDKKDDKKKEQDTRKKEEKKPEVKEVPKSRKQERPSDVKQNKKR